MSKNKTLSQKLKSKMILLLMALIFIAVLMYAFRYMIYDNVLNSNAVQITATIVDEKNILSHSAINPEFTYSYQFFIDGKNYKGDSKNEAYDVGDKITVEYWPTWPKVNRPKMRR